MLLLFNTSAAGGVSTLNLIEIIFINHSSMKVLLEDDISISIASLELGLKVAEAVTLSATV